MNELNLNIELIIMEPLTKNGLDFDVLPSCIFAFGIPRR